LKAVLKNAIEMNSNFEKLPRFYLIDHRKEGENCPENRKQVEKNHAGGTTKFVIRLSDVNTPVNN
ncbi:hypothetical protein AKJ39_00365, partial [candidate division MSBL1 archaeon SCGC-AAA259J03]